MQPFVKASLLAVSLSAAALASAQSVRVEKNLSL